MNALDSKAVRRTWIFILAYSATFLSATLRRAGETPLLGRILAAAVTIGTIWYTARALDLWQYFMSFSRFK